MANTRGGSAVNLRTMSPSDREEAFKQAAAEGNWIGASLQSPAVFDDIVSAATKTIDGYTEILNTGTTLLEVNSALAIAALNPISAVISELIEAVQNQINDFMGAGFYILFIDGQNDGLSAYGIKKTAPVIKIERWKTGGIYTDPFTDTVQFSVQRLANIENVKESDKNLGTNVASQYINNPKKYLIWDGNIFDKTSQKPVFEAKQNMSNTLDVTLVNKINDWRAGLQSVPPDKMIQIINQSFDDIGDNERPRFSSGGTVGGLVMIVGATDPTQLFGKIAKLYNFFSTLEPLRAAASAAKALKDEANEFRKQRLKVRNLCAPNKTQNPPKEQWPIDLSNTKSNIQADWDDFKIGTNSDNYIKYNKRNIDISGHKDDKILFKNVRTGQTFQIIKAGPSKEIQTPVTTGSPHATDPESFGEPIVDPIDILTQSTTTTYSQEWEALFDSFDPDTLPGDLLIEVELDDKYLLWDSEKETPESGENWYDRYNSYCLKNGTKVTGENDKIEDLLKIVLLNRERSANAAYVTSETKAWEYYSEELNKGTESKYYDELQFQESVSSEEAQRYREKLYKENFINAGVDENNIPEYDVYQTPEIFQIQKDLAELLKQKNDFITSDAIGLSQSAIQSQILNLNNENNQFDIQINDVNNKLNSVNEDIDVLTDEISEIESRISEIEGDFTFSLDGNYTTKNALDELNEAKAAIFRSKVKWAEEGEKNTKYFLNLEKRTF